jgi:hypothetical protein
VVFASAQLTPPGATNASYQWSLPPSAGVHWIGAAWVEGIKHRFTAAINNKALKFGLKIFMVFLLKIYID